MWIVYYVFITSGIIFREVKQAVMQRNTFLNLPSKLWTGISITCIIGARLCFKAYFQLTNVHFHFLKSGSTENSNVKTKQHDVSNQQICGNIGSQTHRDVTRGSQTPPTRWRAARCCAGKQCCQTWACYACGATWRREGRIHERRNISSAVGTL